MIPMLRSKLMPRCTSIFFSSSPSERSERSEPVSSERSEPVSSERREAELCVYSRDDAKLLLRVNCPCIPMTTQSSRSVCIARVFP